MSVQKSLQSVASEEKIERCPDCGSSDIERKKDERYCNKCGLVFE